MRCEKSGPGDLAAFGLHSVQCMGDIRADALSGLEGEIGLSCACYRHQKELVLRVGLSVLA
ncbi:hypothetical protein E2C01_024549 [Portunus trituberculatus]|uniref:Uncharacterized protein n=1 Tax=Portunus trituberculatus TaxID=210409 RepID=A0A5B7EF23_PORTR|nr:hypothetical protein [Portunus trituberculatus]